MDCAVCGDKLPNGSVDAACEQCRDGLAEYLKSKVNLETIDCDWCGKEIREDKVLATRNGDAVCEQCRDRLINCDCAVDVRGPWPIVIYNGRRTYTLLNGRDFSNKFAEVDVAVLERIQKGETA